MIKSKWILLFIILGFAIVFIKMPLGKKNEDPGLPINWVPFSTGIAIAQTEKRPVFLYFHADWCGYCKKMERETFKNPLVSAHLNAGFIAIKVDYDHEKEIANKLGVRGLPTVFIMDAKGESKGPIPGFISAKKLLTLLENP